MFCIDNISKCLNIQFIFFFYLSIDNCVKTDGMNIFFFLPSYNVDLWVIIKCKGKRRKIIPAVEHRWYKSVEEDKDKNKTHTHIYILWIRFFFLFTPASSSLFSSSENDKPMKCRDQIIKEKKWCFCLMTLRQRCNKKKWGKEKKKIDTKELQFFFSWEVKRKDVIGSTWSSDFTNRYISVCCSSAHSILVYISKFTDKTKYFWNMLS